MAFTRVVHVKDNVAGAVYVGRAMPRQRLVASPFANPYKVGRDGTREQVILKYRLHLLRSPELQRQAIRTLAGKPIACWCRHEGESEPACHADVLVELCETGALHVPTAEEVHPGCERCLPWRERGWKVVMMVDGYDAVCHCGAPMQRPKEEAK